MSYFDDANNKLRFTKCANHACSSYTRRTLTGDGIDNIMGEYTSIAMGADGLPVISYMVDIFHYVGVIK